MKRTIAWFAQNHVAANLVMVLLVAGGLAAMSSINQKSFPDIEVEVISVRVPFLGATPEEVEEGVCVRVEEKIQGIAGIQKITSSAPTRRSRHSPMARQSARFSALQTTPRLETTRESRHATILRPGSRGEKQ